MMIPMGYMAKKVEARPEHIQNRAVKNIYSVTGCASQDFCDYINHWKHNGYWLLDEPAIISDIAQKVAVDLDGTQLFYYEGYHLEFDETHNQWIAFKPESNFPTNVKVPIRKQLEGYDVVCVRHGTSVARMLGCSPLICNGLADETEVNEHCLLTSFEKTKEIVDSGFFDNAEPGPYRILAVYTVSP